MTGNDRLEHRQPIVSTVFAGNCHLTRRTEQAIQRAGFDITQLQRESIRKAMPLTRPSIRGIAVKPLGDISERSSAEG